MKAFLFVTTILASLATQAATYPITDRVELQNAKDAVILAIPQNKSLCQGAKGGAASFWRVAELISRSKSASQTDGEQPLLTFTHQYNDGQDLQMVMIVSGDKRTITRIFVEEYTYGKINDGNLVNPNIKEGWVFKRRVECAYPN